MHPTDICTNCGHQKQNHEPLIDDSTGELVCEPCDFPNCECEFFTLARANKLAKGDTT